jgi:sialidase-1
MNQTHRCCRRWLPLLLGWTVLEVMRAVEPAGAGLANQVLFASGEAGATRYRIPNVHVTGRGTAIAYVEARFGGGGDGTPADLVLRRSADGGRTWGEKQRVVQHTAKANLVFPLLAEDRGSGRLFFFYAERAGGLRDATRNFYLTSTDEGRTWSAPIDVTAPLLASDRAMAEAIRTQRAAPQFAGEAAELYAREIFVFGPGRPIQLSARHPRHPERILVPVFAIKDRVATPRVRRGYGDAVLVSDDHGQSWHAGGIAPIGEGEASEVDIVELADGRLMLNARQSPSAKPTGLPSRMLSYSADGGDTWTRPRRDDSGIPSYNECHSCLLRLTEPATDPTKTARLLFSFPAANRTHGTILLSYDEHRSWPVRKEIIPGTFGYSNLAVLPDHSVLLIYEGAKSGVHLTRFTLEWLTDGRDSISGGPRRP